MRKITRLAIHTYNKVCGLIFHWQENSWGINFRCNGTVVGTIIVGYAKYASYCGLIFVDGGIPQTLYTSKISTHMVTLGYYRRIQFL